MEIEYLQSLQENNYLIKDKGGEKFYNQGYSINEIEQFELEINSGNRFPLVVRELLFLGGKRCNILYIPYDEGIKKLHQYVYQEFDLMVKQNTSRPYLAFSDDPFGALQYHLVYLDGNDDPIVVIIDISFDSNGNWAITSFTETIQLSIWVEKSVKTIVKANEGKLYSS